MYDRALPLLSAVKDTLTTLEIRDCKSITDQGVRSLKNLKYVLFHILLLIIYDIKGYFFVTFLNYENI